MYGNKMSEVWGEYASSKLGRMCIHRIIVIVLRARTMLRETSQFSIQAKTRVGSPQLLTTA